MPSIADIRGLYPEKTSGLSDLEIADKLAKSSGRPLALVANDLGVELPKQNSGLLGDTGTMLKRGVQQIPGMLTGLGDIAAGYAGFDRPFDQGYEALGELTGFRPSAWARDTGREYSAATQAAQQEVDAAQGFWGTTGAYLENPRAAYVAAGETVPSMAAGGVFGRGLRALTPVGRVGAAAAGEGTVMAGQAMNNIDSSVDPRAAALASTGIGIGGAALGVIGGAAARRMGLEDIDVLAASGRRATDVNPMPMYKRVPAGFVQEGFLEEAPQSILETGFTNLAEGRDFTEGMGKSAASGIAAGGLMGGAANILSAPRLAAKEEVNLVGTNERLQNFSDTYRANNPDFDPRLQGQMRDMFNTNVAGYGPVDPTAARVASERDALGYSPSQFNAYANRQFQLDGFTEPDYGPAPVQGELTYPEPLGLVQEQGDMFGMPEQSGYSSARYGSGDGSWMGMSLVPTDQPAAQGGLQPPSRVRTVTNPAPRNADQKGFIEAYNEPSGQWVTDPSTQLERQLTVGEYYAIQNGVPLSEVLSAPVAGTKTVPRAGTKVPKQGVQNALQVQGQATAQEVNQPTPLRKAREASGVKGGQVGRFNKMVSGLQDADAETIAARIRETYEETQIPEWADKAHIALTGESRIGYEDRRITDEDKIAQGFVKITDAKGNVRWEKPKAAANRGVKGAALAENVTPYNELPEATKYLVQDFMGWDVDGQPNVDGTKPMTLRQLAKKYSSNTEAIKKELAAAGYTEGYRQRSQAAEREESGISSVSESEAAQAGLTYRKGQGGSSKADNDEFDDTYGYERGDTTLTEEEKAAGVTDETGNEEYDDAGYDIELGSMTAEDYDLGISTWGSIYEELRSRNEAAVPLAALSENDLRLFAGKLKEIVRNPGRQDEFVDRVLTAYREVVDGQENQDVVGQSETGDAGRTEGQAGGSVPEADGTQQDGTDGGEVAREGGTAEVRKSVGSETQGTVASKVRSTLKQLFLSPERFDQKVKVVQSVTEIPEEVRRSAKLESSDTGTQAFVLPNGTAWLIADNIPQGSELAVFLHEIGVHVGMEKLLGAENFTRLAQQIAEWSARTDTSMEAKIARRAMERVENAERSAQQDGREFEDGDFLHETIAYFIEEAVNAGINPTAVQNIKSAGLREWFRQFMAALKVGLRKIGLGRFDKLTAQNLVDLAYGAADLELSGTYHGTAANFRRFDHRYMGTGEGAQAFGWGTYLAQRYGIAKEYWKADKQNKTKFDPREIKAFEGGELAEDIVDPETGKPAFKKGELLTDWDMRQIVGFAKHNQVESIKVLKDGEVSEVKFYRYAPEGSLMAVRPLVAEDEMLDWDKPIEEQPIWKILKADGFAGHFTGKQIYDSLEGLKGSDKAASEYLDSIGIKGIKFLDAVSRSPKVDFIGKAGDEIPAIKHAMERNGGDFEDALASVIKEAKKRAALYGNDYSHQKSMERLLSVPKKSDYVLAPETRNIVVFNDKNIARVATQVGADTNNVRFSKNYVESLPADLQEPVRYVGDAVADMSRRGLIYSMFTDDLVDLASKVIPSARSWYNAVKAREVERIKQEQLIDSIATEFDSLDRNEFKRTWGAIYHMTKNQKWGYTPEWNKGVTVDPDAKELYDQLSDKEKQLVDRVFKHGYDTAKEIEAVLNATIDAEYADKLAKANTPEEKAKLEKEKAKYKNTFGAQMAKLDGPYAPLRRVGSHVVVAKSQRYLDAEGNNDTKELEAIKSDANHYLVMFVDSMAEAQSEQRRLQGTGTYSEVTAKEKDAFVNDNQLPFQAFEQLRRMVEEKDGKVAEKLNNLITQLYLTSLAETSARKSDLRREAVAGMDDPDAMYKAFISKGISTSHYISQLKNGKEVGDMMAVMRAQAHKSTDHRAVSYFNELYKRYSNTADANQAPVVNKLMGFNTLWSLLTKPAYYVYNATQPALMTQPYLSQRHSYTDSGNAMLKAYKELAGIKGYLKAANFDVDMLPADVRNGMRDLMNMGKLDITINQDLGSRMGQGRTNMSRGLGKIDKFLRHSAQKVETTNRLVTGMAAYRLELKKNGGDHNAAVEYAAKVIDKTQGDYSNLNAPRLMNATSIQRLITQFRKFQLIQVSYLVRMAKDAMLTADPNEKAAIRRALMYTLGHHAVLAGALGLPAANIIALVFSATGDDDEPRNLELSLRRAIGDQFISDLLLRGVPAAVFNVNMSSNVGMGQAFSLLPFTDLEASRQGYEAALTGSMGPLLGGIAPQMWAGMGYMMNGDYIKGLEGFLPSGVRAMVKAGRELDQGVTNTRGDTLVNAEEISMIQSMAKALGFRTNDDAMRQFVQSQKYEAEQWFNKRTTQLKKEYAEAYRDGDSEAMREAILDWGDMQDAKKLYGFKSQPLSNLLKAPAEQRKRETNTTGGVQYNTGNKKFVEQFAN